MNSSTSFVWIVAFVAALMPKSSGASGCDGLAALSLPDTRITSAEAVAAGAFKLPPDASRADSSFFTAFEKLRSFCRVRGAIEPTKDSHIEFEVWLPSEGWNRKYVGAGNGGFGGTINYFRLAEAVNAGYAASATDTGHRGTVGDTSWALHHPEKVIDFNDRAVHETAENAKVIMRAMYATSLQRSYFNSCSNGGRQGIVEAQRYPADYDGILAGAPAFNYGRTLARNEGLPDVDETIPNLDAFRARGGRLILYHGERDSPAETVTFYERVRSSMGEKTASEFVRLFVVPGMGHCGGGPFPEFGLRLQPGADPKHSMTSALEHWVEDGVAPSSVVATKYRVDDDPSSGVLRTRPLCAYPMEAQWTGKGSRDDAASYTCVRDRR
jgi:tannase/feruloyl esterase